jgi:PAS domain S-box-containing protein
MTSLTMPPNETERLESLQRYGILDTPPEREYDDLALVAARLCHAPAAAISLVDADRQWLKATVGLAIRETPRHHSFCTAALDQPGVLVVPDAASDPRFQDSPLVTGDPHVRFYAGAPLRMPDSQVLGTLCVFDYRPRQLEPHQVEGLEALARQVVTRLELGRAQQDLQRTNELKSRLIECSLDCIKVLDLEGRMLSMNAGGMRVLEICDLGPLIGQSWVEFWSGEDRDAARVAVATARRGETGRFVGFFETLQTRRPMWWDVAVSPILDGDGRPVQILAVSRDITQQRETQIALQKAVGELEQLKHRLQAENQYLHREIQLHHDFEDIVGTSAGIRRNLQQIEQVAPTDSTVLILGETGTGKELLARAIHRRSTRREKPLISVNCGAISPGLIESELFGHEKGAFTGALNRKIGRFEMADGGTLFLDEIGDLAPELQVKLLRVLQEGEIERVGSAQMIRVNVRVIAATHRDLPAMVKGGRFRQDLYYRLNVFPLRTPPLRERKEDIPLLVRHFVLKHAARLGKRIDEIPAAVLDRLTAYDWPGNIRELANVIERSVIVTAGTGLTLEEWMTGRHPVEVQPGVTLLEAERRHILEALEKCGWKVSGAGGSAELLGLKPTTLEARMKKLGIARPR